jgi:ribose 5-phosphate isomerase A
MALIVARIPARRRIAADAIGFDEMTTQTVAISSMSQIPAGQNPGSGSQSRFRLALPACLLGMSIESDKRAAAMHAAGLVQDGMRVGLGTGTTVAELLPALAARRLALRCVATSEATAAAARAVGLAVEPFDALDRLDIAIDGADQIDAHGWLVKGKGGAHTREKVAAAAADRFVVIASGEKLVERVGPPVPLELLPFGLAATVRALDSVVLRGGPPSPDGGVIADWTGAVDDPVELAARLAATPGVVGHGLFQPSLVSDLVVARDGVVEHVTIEA